MWFSVGRFAPLLLCWAGLLCCRVVDKMTGVFGGGVVWLVRIGNRSGGLSGV